MKDTALATLVGGLVAGSLLAPFFFTEFAPLPAPRALALVGIFLSGLCLGVLAPDIRKALLGCLLMSLLGSFTMLLLLMLPTLLSYGVDTDVLLYVVLQRVAAGTLLLALPLELGGMFVGSFLAAFRTD